MNFRIFILFLCVSTLFVNSFPIGKDNESDETETDAETSVETTTETENEETDSQEETLEDQLNEVEEETRKKRGMYSSERTEEEVEMGHGIHHREKRHAEHISHPDPLSHTVVKRSSDHHRIKRSEGHTHEKKSSHNQEGHVAIMAKDDHHGHEKRSSGDHHEHQKRSADDHHGHREKRSEHVEHHLEKQDHQKRHAPEGHGEHHLVKRSGGEGGHRHHRSTDQGILEDVTEDEGVEVDEVFGNETDDSKSRQRRNTDTPLPSFPSDHDASEHSNSPFE